MTSSKKTFSLLSAILLLLFVPQFSHAAGASASQAQDLYARLATLSTQLNATSTMSTITLTPGVSAFIATSTAENGLLNITFVHELHTNPDPLVPKAAQAPVVYLAQLSLQYLPCVSVPTSRECTTQSSAAFPLEPSELPLQGSTQYLNTMIQLTALSSSTASLTLTNETALTNIQMEVQQIATQVQTLLGK